MAARLALLLLLLQLDQAGEGELDSGVVARMEARLHHCVEAAAVAGRTLHLLVVADRMRYSLVVEWGLGDCRLNCWLESRKSGYVRVVRVGLALVGIVVGAEVRLESRTSLVLGGCRC